MTETDLRGGPRQGWSVIRRLVSRPAPGSAWSVDGAIWAAVIAIDFVLMSNPLIFITEFTTSLDWALAVTVAGALLTLPRLRLPTVPISVLLFLAWCLLSMLWSLNADATYGTTVMYAKIAVIAIVAGSNVDSIVCATGIAAGGALVMAGSYYTYDRQWPGAIFVGTDRTVMQGIGTNQNILAYTLVIALAAILSFAVPRRSDTLPLWIGTVGVFAYGLFKAYSTTGFLTAACVVVATVALWLAARFALRSRRAYAIGLAGGAAVLVGGFILAGSVLGKDSASFSGRLPFWEAAIKVGSDRPLTGFGWGAVWGHPWRVAPPNDVLNRIYDTAGLALTHGHNSFVDIFPETGLIGVLLGVAIFFQLGYRAFSRAGEGSTEVGARSHYLRLLTLGLVALLIFGISEPLLTIPLGWWTAVLLLSVQRPRGSAPDAIGQRATGVPAT